ncbi:hypothetical protein MMC12_003941 [Toensbergia leucococca]|nr:hypothetical protein [Toensbergia leucococca]
MPNQNHQFPPLDNFSPASLFPHEPSPWDIPPQQAILTTIRLSLSPTAVETPDMEPLPTLDYHLIHTLIAFSRAILPPRDLKLLDYLADARKYYYIVHSKFHTAYNALADAHAYGVILDNQNVALNNTTTTTTTTTNNTINNNNNNAPTPEKAAEKRTQNAEARVKNDADLQRLLAAVQDWARRRDQVSVWFSSAKCVFVETQMPRLVHIAKWAYQRHLMQQQRFNALPTSTSSAVPQPPAAQKDLASSSPTEAVVGGGEKDGQGLRLLSVGGAGAGAGVGYGFGPLGQGQGERGGGV